MNEQQELFLARALELSLHSPGVEKNVCHLHEKGLIAGTLLCSERRAEKPWRNSSYFRAAVLRAVRRSSNCTVLDIESGTGILRLA